MSDPQPAPARPQVAEPQRRILLALQVGLLWIHGSLLQRQHEDIQALREDVQALADSIYEDQDQDGWDSNQADPNPRPHPARWKGRPGRKIPVALVRAAGESDEGDPALKEANKELDASLKSGQEAVVKARKVQEQLSLSTSYEQAGARKRMEEAGWRWMPWLGAGIGVGLGAMLLRSFHRRRA